MSAQENSGKIGDTPRCSLSFNLRLRENNQNGEKKLISNCSIYSSKYKKQSTYTRIVEGQHNQD